MQSTLGRNFALNAPGRQIPSPDSSLFEESGEIIEIYNDFFVLSPGQEDFWLTAETDLCFDPT